jgi:hypothetical protein
MAAPFRIKKGDVWGPWKAIVGGKTVELANAESTKEDADAALARLIPSSPTTEKPKPKNTLGALLNTESNPELQSTNSADSTPSSTPTEKPKPGELRKNGLSELTPARLAKFREQVAFAISSGNVTLDRALVSIFRDKVPVLAPEQYMLLATGWELACEQYFVNGVPPAWVIILLGNALVCTALVEKSEPKKEEVEPNVRADGNPAYKREPPLK